MPLNSLNESPVCTLPPSKLITGLNARCTLQINSWENSCLCLRKIPLSFRCCHLTRQEVSTHHPLLKRPPSPCFTFPGCLSSKESGCLAEGAHSLSQTLLEPERRAVCREERCGDACFRQRKIKV